MKTPNAGIESLETRVPDTWRPPSRSIDPEQSFRELETLPPPRRSRLAGTGEEPEARQCARGSLGDLELSIRDAAPGEFESGCRDAAMHELDPPWGDLGPMNELGAMGDLGPMNEFGAMGDRAGLGAMGGPGAMGDRGGLGELASPWQEPSPLRALERPDHELREHPKALALVPDLALSDGFPVPPPKDLRPSLLDLGLSTHEIECFSPLAARLSSEQIVSAAQAILTSRPRAVNPSDAPCAPPTARVDSTPPVGGARPEAPSSRRETARPPVRRLRDTQRPGQRRPSESARPLPSLRTMEARRFPSRPPLAPAATRGWRVTAPAPAPAPAWRVTAPAPATTAECRVTAPAPAPAPAWRVTAPAPAAARPPPVVEPKQTLCCGCHATTPTQRASTLSSIGWRPGPFPDPRPPHGQRWFCPKCHTQGDGSVTPSAAERKG